MVPGVLGDRGIQRVQVPKCTHQSRRNCARKIKAHKFIIEKNSLKRVQMISCKQAVLKF